MKLLLLIFLLSISTSQAKTNLSDEGNFFDDIGMASVITEYSINYKIKDKDKELEIYTNLFDYDDVVKVGDKICYVARNQRPHLLNTWSIRVYLKNSDLPTYICKVP